jgi:hypothetical protein
VIRVVVDANVLDRRRLPDPRWLDRRSCWTPRSTAESNCSARRYCWPRSPPCSRPRLRRYLSPDEALRFVSDLASQTTHVADAPTPHPALCRDPHDDDLVALAVAARADAIVTGDRDLLELPDPPLAVLTPRALIERLDAPL